MDYKKKKTICLNMKKKKNTIREIKKTILNNFFKLTNSHFLIFLSEKFFFFIYQS
jgi:hypothetical protein